MKSNAYWINRVNEVLADNHQSSTEQILRINKAYEQAAKDIQRDIDQIFNTYANHHNLTPTQAKKLLNGKIDNFIYPILKRIYPRLSEGKLKDWCLAELNANAYRARITRLEALKKSVKLHCLEVYEQELKLSKASYIKTIKEAYYRTCYNFQRGINLAFDVANINTRAVNMILNTEWFGRNYSDSVWNNTQALVDRLDETITKGFLSGKKLSEIAKELEILTSYGMFAAERLVRTETTFFNNQAALQGYKEVGVEKYVYVATLDIRTCSCGKHGRPSCGELDRKVFEIAKQEPSINCPPMHAFCRCTIRAYINDAILNRAKRRARNPITGKNEIVGNMSYEEWYNKYVKGNPEAELAVKKERNLYVDKKQYEKYKSVLGKEAPKTFEDFQNLKYNEVEKWEQKKREYATINDINEKQWSDAYKEKVKNTYYDFKKDNVEMSWHGAQRFLERSIDKNGNQIFFKSDIITIFNEKPNYIQEDGRLVNFNNGLAVIRNENTNEIVSIVVRKNPKVGWKANDQKNP